MRTLLLFVALVACVAFAQAPQSTPSAPLVTDEMIAQWNARDRNLMSGQQVTPFEAWNMGAYAVREVYETMIARGELVKAKDCKGLK